MFGGRWDVKEDLHFQNTRILPLMFKAKEPKMKKSRGKGGMWRLFVKSFTSGKSGSPNLTEVSEYYQRWKKNNAHLGRSQPAKTYAARKKRKDESKTMRLAALHSGFFKKARQHAGERKRSIVMLWMERHKHESFQKRLSSLMVHKSDGIDGVAVARAVAKYESEQNDQVKAESIVMQDKYHSSLGVKEVAVFREVLPCLTSVELEHIPHEHWQELRVKPSTLLDKAVQGCSWMSANKQTNMGPCLDKIWQQLHQTVEAEVEHTLVDDEDEAQEVFHDGQCMRFGRCICNSSGLKLKQCKDRLLKILKGFCQTSEDKKLMGKGCTVICVTLGFESSCSGSSAPENFWHVGHMSWSPFRPTFQVMQRSYNPDGLSAEEVVYLKAS
eukprot:6491941-Amphidinium_carterae.2